MDKHTPDQIFEVMDKWIDTNYQTLSEAFLQRGYERKMSFPRFCIQSFRTNYNRWLESKQKKDVRTDAEF
jgi:hypothetical protein